MSGRVFPEGVRPHALGLGAEWYAQCASSELRFQRCEVCRAWRHPPRVLCAACGSDAWSWQPSTGRGSLFSWTVTHQALHPAYADRVPYVVAVVELEEGVRVVTALAGVALGDLALDLPLQCAIEVVAEGVGMPYFRAR
jgi:uncharacterized protein